MTAMEWHHNGSYTTMLKQIVLSLCLIVVWRASAQEPPIEVTGRVDSLLQLSKQYRNDKKFEVALQLNTDIRLIVERRIGENNSIYGNVVFDSGKIEYAAGDHRAAEQCFRRGLRIQDQARDAGDISYLENLIYMGDFCLSTNRLKWVEYYYKKALQVQSERVVVDSVLLGDNLHKLGDICFLTGQIENSKRYYLHSLAVKEKIHGRNHRECASVINDLAIFYYKTKQFEAAEPLLDEALAIIEKEAGKESADYGWTLSNFGGYYMYREQYKKAESYFLEASTVIKNAHGVKSREYAWSIDAIGKCYFRLEEYDKAEQYYLQAMSIRKSLMGAQSYDYAVSLRRMCTLYSKTKEHNKAKQYYKEASALNLDHAQIGTSFLTTTELKRFLPQYILAYDELLTYLYTNVADCDSQLFELAYDNTLFYKGFILNNSSFLSQIASTLPDSIVNTLERWQRTLRLLAKEYGRPIAARQAYSQLEKKANRLEKELVLSVDGFGNAIRQVSWEEVRDVLHPSEAAVEFIRFDFSAPVSSGELFYAALVVRHGDVSPQLVPLFKETTLDTVLQRVSEAGIQYYNKLYQFKADRNSLYHLIWQPLDSLLEGMDKIYASPSGLLHRLNLGAIMSDADHTFADRYALSILGSTRQLVIKEEEEGSQELTAAVYGGIRYDLDSIAIAEALKGRLDTMEFYEGGELSFSYLKRSTPERGRSWDYLPGTAEEVEAITNLLVEGEGEVDKYSDYTATEESIKAMGKGSNAPRILHIATHGYFYPDPEEDVKQSTFYDHAPAFKVSDHPMIRSGLIMAGGNHTWKGNPPLKGWEDGILTAYEVSQLDLRSTELAVLSACETGLGDIDGNEGVYGLQRAFRIAGVDKLIMSLWSVPDEQTQEMMVLFYDNWLKEGMEIEVAFRAAQREMRERYEAHYYWASFVLVR